MKYGAMMIDPPWYFKAYSDETGSGRGAMAHYGVMDLNALKAMREEILDLAAYDFAAFVWAIDPMLPQALSVVDSWGLTFKTVAFYWVKQNKKSDDFFTGMGYWTRANPEQCLLAVRGKPKRLSASVRRLIVSPRREHSRKPDEAYARVEALVEGPYMDVFSREKREGWDQYGNEVDKF